jgi:hypothetical protein
MRTGINLLTVFIFLGFLTWFNPVVAQKADTVENSFPNTFWTKQRFVPKVGAGIQERPMVEVGIYWQNIYSHPLTLASKGPYASIDLLIDDDNFLIGPKLGYELTAGVIGVAFDVTYYFDQNYDNEGNHPQTIVGTPKAGITLLGFVDLFYGYQIPFSEQRITSLSRHRLSINFNLNKDYFNLKNAPRKSKSSARNK